MESSEQKSHTGQMLEVHGSNKWQMYRRLQELGISCWCEANQPLRVPLNAGTAVQFWSVSQQLQMSRPRLVQ